MNHAMWLEAGSIVKWCALECERQSSGELSVSHMFDAWAYAYEQDTRRTQPGINKTDIILMGALVEPVKNIKGYRTTPVSVGSQVISSENIEHQIDTLVQFQKGNGVTSEDIYKEFELIHPFIDGNGRVGSIVYNWLNGTLHRPIAPPDVFAISISDYL